MISLEDLKAKKIEELGAVSNAIRKKILDTVSENGGHLASNLGIVEATVALHYVFNSPNDKIIFDVGHQCYAHKLLTGRDGEFSNLRQYGGISGFTNREESCHDILTEGHSGTSISQALGIAEANKLMGKNDYVIAVVGDGSFTNGMIYEALNNCAEKDLKLIILLNDNEMSISKSVGGVSGYLSKIRTSKKYFGLKRKAKKVRRVPLIGKPIVALLAGIKNGFKRIFVRNNFFECLGLDYIGPVDGNNVAKMVSVLREAKTKSEGVVVVHITTKKGLGHKDAEKHPEKYHSTSKLDKNEDKSLDTCPNFSDFMGNLLLERAKEDEKICAVTAAMCDGTGLSNFAKELPDRFFDVGIAEEHAITFSAGLSLSGYKPVVALYSTFAQRAYDQLLHDLSIQNLPLTLLLDRAGIVAGDGITHQGIFDYSLFSMIPNVNIYSPETFKEAEECLNLALNSEKINIIRYPKGNQEIYENYKMARDGMLEYSPNLSSYKTVIVTYGKVSKKAKELASRLNAGIIKLIQICPIDYEKIEKLLEGCENVFFLEEGILSGGVGEKISARLRGKKIKIKAIESFIPHGELDKLYEHIGFDIDSLEKEINALK